MFNDVNIVLGCVLSFDKRLRTQGVMWPARVRSNWFRERQAHGRGCIPILAHGNVTFQKIILIQHYMDFSFIHGCVRKERATMMLVCRACVLP